MCGIAGLVNLNDLPPPDAGLLRRMAGALRHRGPDEFGVYRDERAGLAHARLSIIDLATGQQPLSQRGRHAVDRLQRRDLQLRRAARRAGARSATASAPAATPRSSSTPTKGGASAPSSASTGSSPSRCGIGARGGWSWRATGSACGRSTSASTAGGSAFAQRGEGDLRGDPGIPRALDPVGLDRDLHLLDDGGPRSRVRGRPRARAGHTLTVDASVPGRPAMRERRYWAPRYPARGEPFRRSLEEAVGGAPRRSGARHAAAHAARRRAGGPLPLRRARQLAGRRARPAGQGRAVPHLLRSASRTPSTTRRPTSAMVAALIGSEHREVWSRARRHRRGLPRRGRATPSGRSCAPRRRRSSCSRGWCATPASRWC